MIIPFIYNLETVSDYDHIAVLYFYLMMVKQTGGAMVAHERYFMDVDELYAQILSRDQLKSTAEFLEFDMPEQSDLDKIGKYVISQQFEDEMLTHFESRLDCWTYLLSKEFEPFTDIIDKIFDSIEQDYGESIEAVLCFYEPISLRCAAERRGFKVIHQEGTSFRTPFYRMAGYFDFKEGYGRGELEERYYKFKEETKDKDAFLFSAKEICALFMTSQGLSQLHLFDSKPQYELGIGITDYSLGVNLKSTLINMDEILLEARKKYPMDQVTTRSRYRVTGCDDDSPSSFHFVLKCKRVAALRSNMSFETMLLGRTACIYGDSPFAFMGNKGISDATDREVPLDFINFTTFGYFVPWEMLRDVEYIRWRLSMPTELEIYERNMRYYLSKRGLEIDRVFEQAPDARLGYILENQNVKADKEYHVKKSSSLKNAYDVLQKEHALLSQSYEELLTGYTQLQKEHVTLSKNHEELLAGYTQLQKEHVSLSKNYEELLAGYTQLQKEHGTVYKSYEDLTAGYIQLQKEHQAAVINYEELLTQFTQLQKEHADSLEAAKG